MEGLIRYVATGCRTEIRSYTRYVEDVCNCLERNGLINYMLSEPSCTKKVTPIIHSDGRKISYEIMYGNSICGITYTWIINMDFYEKKSGTELRININSQTYMLNIEDSYLIKLRQVIEDYIENDWKTIVIIVDAYSDMLNTLLFPEMHRIENVCRRLVAGFMINTYGASEWLNTDCNVDNTIFGMGIGDFDAIITSEWDTIFSQYFSAEFLEAFHRLSGYYGLLRDNYRCDKSFYYEVKKTMEGINRDIVAVLWKFESTI